MNARNFPKNRNIGLMLLILFMTSGLRLTGQTTYTSTAAGGLWNSASTWSGGAVPAAGSNIVIAGTVYLNTNYTANNLTINAGCLLYTETYTTSYLTVNGTILNNGGIGSHPTSGYALNLVLLGNAENNGTWTVRQTSFSGTANQTIKQGAGKRFEGYFITSDATGDIVLGSDVTLFNNTWDFSKSRLVTNGYKFSTVNYRLNNGIIQSNDTLILKNTVVDAMAFDGNYKIRGKLKTMGNVVMNGTVTILDTLQNEPYYTSWLTVNGKIINKGKILKDPVTQYAIVMLCMVDIENNGIWAPQDTRLSGTKDQHLKQSAGKSFQGYFLTTDSVGQIYLDSDVTFDGNTWDFSLSKLRTNGFTPTFRNYRLNNGTIISNDQMNMRNSVMVDMNLQGSYIIGGKIKVLGGNTFNGTVTILDTLQNEAYSTSYLPIKGKIINNGKILKDPVTGYALVMYLHGDVENNGIWAPQETRLVGTVDQHLKQSPGKSFQGYFLTTDTLGQIVLDSHVTFDGNIWDWSQSTMRTNGYQLTTNNYRLNNGKILSYDQMNLTNTVIADMTFDGNYKIDGKWKVLGGNKLKGTVTVLDTLQNESFSTSYLDVPGKIINNGKIIKDPRTGYALVMQLYAGVENNGIWAPQETKFMGLTDQHLKQTAGKFFQGYFLTTDTVGQIILDSNVTFDGNTWDWTKSTLRTNGFQLTTSNYRLNNGIIISNDQINLRNTILADMTFRGNYKIGGKCKVLGGNRLEGTVTILDTLQNEPFNTTYLDIPGKIINNGLITRDVKSGYSLLLNILGDIENNGIWTPADTRFLGTSDQSIKQSPGKTFSGYFMTSDTLGHIILAGDVTFSDNTWDMNKSKLLTNGNTATFRNFRLNNGIILSNDTIEMKKSQIADMTFSGNFSLAGKTLLLGANTFTGNVTLADTLYNEVYYTSYLTVNGNFVNNGIFTNNPVSYTARLYISGNLENNKVLNLAEIYLTGTGDRTIGGKNASSISANVYVDNAISLTGSNALPNMNFTGAPAAGCTVRAGATLTLLAPVNSAKIKNYGRISISQYIDNTYGRSWDFYAASLYTPAKTPLTKLIVDNYGYQQHPTATGTVNTWWRVRNTPQLFKDSLNWLKLSYFDDALNGNIEDSIKVFHSPNAGLTWKRIKSGITIDKTNNLVTINKAPSYGHYLLSSSALGITSFQPLVESAEPRFGGNTGYLSMYMFGAGFKKTSTVSLKLAGQADIKADSTWLTDMIGESMQARFNLKNKSLGVYDVVVETPGEKTITLPAYFTVEKGERSNPWITLTGRDRFLINRWQTFNINYGNTANTDALGTILVFAITDLPGLSVEFPDFTIVFPKSLASLGKSITRFRDSLNIYYVTDSLSGYENVKMRVYPLYIPYIPSGASKYARVKVMLNGQGSLKMESWILDPLYEKVDYNLKAAEPIPTEVRACITAAAMKAWYHGSISGLGSLGFPGLACWSVIDKSLALADIEPVDLVTPDEIKPEPVSSMFWTAVSWVGSAVQCGSSFVPGIGTAVSVGIGVANMMIDVKDGKDATEGCWRKFRKKCQNKLNSRGVTSMDPNEKTGPQGYTADRYISKEGNINYSIYFENKKTAGAPALEVFIKDTLDTKKFDFSTFSFSRIAFGDTSVKIQEFAKEFRILIDRYPKKNIIVQVHGKLDTITGVVSWDFHSLDRITLELTEDPDLGFLPPNANSPEGEGNVTFSCKLKGSVAHGDLITNRASIIFDLNAPILTNTFSNKIDDRVPSSSVSPLPLTQKDSLFTVTWTGSDLGSKISKINIFVSRNDSAYVLWKSASIPGSAQFKGRNNIKYKFYSVATDSIGFAETMKSSPEAVTTIDIKTASGLTGVEEDRLQVFPNPADNICTVAFNFDRPCEAAISLEDISGKRVTVKEKAGYQPGHQTVTLDISGLPEGMYIVKLANDQGMLYRKLVIRR